MRHNAHSQELHLPTLSLFIDYGKNQATNHVHFHTQEHMWLALIEQAYIYQTQWHSGRVLDLRPGRGFDSLQPRFQVQLWASCSYMCLSHQAV